MAQYEHLPIFKKAYDLTLYFEKIVRNFSRYHKYSVGAELRQLSPRGAAHHPPRQQCARQSAAAAAKPRAAGRLENHRAAVQRLKSLSELQFISIQHQRGGGPEQAERGLAEGSAAKWKA